MAIIGPIYIDILNSTLEKFCLLLALNNNKKKQTPEQPKSNGLCNMTDLN